MLRLALLSSCVALITGCATSEHFLKAEFFKPSPLSGKSESNRYFPQKADLRPTDAVSVQVSLCGDDKKKILCIETYPEDGVVFQFAEPTVVFSPSIGKTVHLPITKVTYNVICHGPRLDGEPSGCQSSPKSPLPGNGAIEKRRVRVIKSGSDFHYNDEYTFSPDQAFTGAQVRVMLHRFSRKYQAVTEAVPDPLGGEFRVSLPQVRVNGQSFELPALVFTHVVEDVCRPTNRPLSLQ
jgi:hypothetical protein